MRSQWAHHTVCLTTLYWIFHVSNPCSVAMSFLKYCNREVEMLTQSNAAGGGSLMTSSLWFLNSSALPFPTYFFSFFLLFKKCCFSGFILLFLLLGLAVDLFIYKVEASTDQDRKYIIVVGVIKTHEKMVIAPKKNAEPFFLWSSWKNKFFQWENKWYLEIKILVALYSPPLQRNLVKVKA